MNLLGVLLIAATATASTVHLDPEAVVARVLEVSAAMSGAEFRVRAAARSAAAADALLLPSVSASASALYRSSAPSFSIPLSGLAPLELTPDIRDVYASGVRLDYLLFSGGAVSGARHAARLDLEAARRAGEQVHEDLRLIATAAYWDAVRAAAGVAAAEAQERRAQRTLTDARAQGDAGMATPADLAAARERVATASVQLIRARATVENAYAALRSLLRLESARIDLADSLTGPLPPFPDSLRSLQRRASEARPEVARAKAQQGALMARSSAAGAGSWPNLRAIAQWDYNRPNQRYFPTEDRWNDSWSLGLVGSWTLFDGGKARAEARSMEAASLAAALDIAELERAVLLEVETVRNDLCSALAAVTAADAALEAAGERERQVRQRHAAGVASIADLLDAEAQLSAAEGLVIDARSGAWIAAARLDRAVGK